MKDQCSVQFPVKILDHRLVDEAVKSRLIDKIYKVFCKCFHNENESVELSFSGGLNKGGHLIL